MDLIFALQNEHTEIAKLLIEKGADISIWTRATRDLPPTNALKMAAAK